MRTKRLAALLALALALLVKPIRALMGGVH